METQRSHHHNTRKTLVSSSVDSRVSSRQPTTACRSRQIISRVIHYSLVNFFFFLSTMLFARAITLICILTVAAVAAIVIYAVVYLYRDKKPNIIIIMADDMVIILELKNSKVY